MNDHLNDAVEETTLPETEEKTPLSAQMQACIQSAVADAVAQEMARQKAAALSPAEQEKAQLDEREAALLAREQALVEREMRSFAREQLARRKLPEALLDALCCQNEECCMESLNRVEQAFRTAVQEGVVERMRGEEPLRGEAAPLDAMDDNAYYHATYVK